MKLKIKHLIIGIFSITIVYLSSVVARSPILMRLLRGEEINGVAIGIDSSEFSHHADNIIILNYESSKRKLNLFSIPRDTKLNLPDMKIKRINEYYAYYYRKWRNHERASLAFLKVVNSLLNRMLEVRFYIMVNYQGFADIIDKIGGVDVSIPKRMRYTDRAGNLEIDFEPGRHHLDGKLAINYIRYRGGRGDIGRIYRMQNFIKSVFSQIKKPSTLIKLPISLPLLLKSVSSNLNFFEKIALLLELRHLNEDDIRFFLLPGSASRYYWEFDRLKFSRMLEKIYISTKKSKKVTVQIWNASSIKNAARNLSSLLLKQKFEILGFGNYSEKLAQTLLLDYSGKIMSAKLIRKILGCGDIITKYDEESVSDIVVIIGEDYGKKDKI